MLFSCALVLQLEWLISKTKFTIKMVLVTSRRASICQDKPPIPSPPSKWLVWDWKKLLTNKQQKLSLAYVNFLEQKMLLSELNLGETSNKFLAQMFLKTWSRKRGWPSAIVRGWGLVKLYSLSPGRSKKSFLMMRMRRITMIMLMKMIALMMMTIEGPKSPFSYW